MDYKTTFFGKSHVMIYALLNFSFCVSRNNKVFHHQQEQTHRVYFGGGGGAFALLEFGLPPWIF